MGKKRQGKYMKKGKNGNGIHWVELGNPVHNHHLLRRKTSGIFYIRYRENGKLILKSLETNRISVARIDRDRLLKGRDLRHRHLKSSNGNGVSPDATFYDILELYRLKMEANPKTKPSTKASYRNSIDSVLLKTWPELKVLKINKIAEEDCYRWAMKLMRDGTGFVIPNTDKTVRGNSPTTFNTALGILKGTFKIAMKKGLILENPAEEIKRLPEREKQLILPNKAQFADFVDAIYRSGAPQARDCGDMVRFLAYTGGRLGESCNVRWRDIDLERQTITFRDTKNSKSRTNPLIPDAFEFFQEMRRRQSRALPEDFILQVNECMKSMERAAGIIGIKRLTHHDLRHLFATYCIYAGVDVPTVADWLGHQDGGAIALRTYRHIIQENAHLAAKKVSFKSTS